MRCRRLLLLALTTLLAAGWAEAASLLFLDNPEGTHVDAGRRLRMDDASGTFTAERLDTGTIRVEVGDASSTRRWLLFFSPPEGGTLATGEYLNAATYVRPDRPSFSVDGDVAGCRDDGGRFLVYELEVDVEGELLELAVDFERPCLSGGPFLTGSLHYRVGDPGCALAADGTACEPYDACSGGGACLAGQCRAVEPVVCSPEHDQCENAAVCHPTIGSCLEPGVAAFGTPCDDGNPCTARDWCRDGVCEAWFGEAVSCNDGDACTDDFCDSAVGCRHAAVAGACGEPGESSTVLFVVDEPPAGSTEPREQRLFTAADAEFRLQDSDDDHLGFLILPTGPEGGSAFVEVRPPRGLRLAAGVYDGTEPGNWSGTAVLRVDDCYGPGRFEVLEVARGVFDRVEAVSFRFDQRCDDGGRRRGTLHYRAGFETCRSLPDGASCDDRNGCTASSSCRGGLCVGSAAPACPSSDACRPAPFCEPIGGACVAGVAHANGTVCDDADPCTTSGLCEAGACVGATPIVSCACLDVPEGGACWTLAGTTVVRASAVGTLRGYSVRCAGSCQRPQSALFLTKPDGTYWAPGGVAACGGEREVPVPAEVGRWQRRRKGTMVLEPDNLGEIAAAAAACSGIKLKAVRTVMEPADDGSVVGRTMLRYRQRAELPITFKSTVHFNGTSDPFALVERPLRTRPARVCDGPLRLRCQVQ